jgi:ribonuclease BN (tRNA processing enzyme)
MEIIFLGTGGGRVNLVKQLRWTGGFRINSKAANIHIDPGPGALTHSHELGQDPLKIDAIVVTHFHVDHCTDAPVLIEAMTGYALKEKGILIGSDWTINGDKEGDRSLSKYHISKIKDVWAPKWGEKRKFTTAKGEFEFEAVKTKHDDLTGIGFKLTVEGITIGCTSDTEFSPDICEAYKGCDFLIVNCLKPTADGIPDHLKTEDVVKLVSVAKPKLAILSHMGLKFIRAGPEKEAAYIEKQSGIRTIAARDGQVFTERSLSK